MDDLTEGLLPIDEDLKPVLADRRVVDVIQRIVNGVLLGLHRGGAVERLFQVSIADDMRVDVQLITDDETH